MLSLFALLVSSAHAQEDGYRDLLSQAKMSLLAGEYKDARDSLARAEEVAPSESARLSTKELAQLFFYRGVLYWRASPESSALENWRYALTIDPGYQPEADLLPEAQERDTFLALGDEVRAQKDVGLDLPEDPGEAVIYIDGREVGEGDTVLPGTHFVQIRCEGGDYAGTWYDFGTPPSDYLTICDGGVYKTGRSSSSSKSSSSSSSKSSSKSGSSKSGSKPSGGGKSGGFSAKDGAGIALIGAGALGGATTVLLYDQASDASIVYDKKLAAAEKNPDIKDAADAYYDDVVLPRFMRTYAVGAASGVLLAGGIVLVIVGAEGPMVTPVPGGGVFTWSGSF